MKYQATVQMRTQFLQLIGANVDTKRGLALVATPLDSKAWQTCIPEV